MPQQSKPRTILLYGDSGISKTTQAYFLAKYIYETTGLKGRMIGSNASDSAPFEDSGLLEKGIVDYYDISSSTQILADLRRLSKGYWPRDQTLTNKKTGEKTTIKKGYFKTDDNCLTTPEQWSKIGFYIIEGITGVARAFLNHIRAQEEGVGFQHSYKYEEDGYIIGGLQQGHYAIVQNEMYQLIVQGFACLPTKWNIWTALVEKGEDRTKESIYGPKSAGAATTYEIPSWFQDTFHIDSVVNKEEGTEKRVGWFIRHVDKETGIPYLSNIRIMPELYGQLLGKYENGYVELGFKGGIDKIYRTMEELKAKYQEGQQKGA